MTFRGQEASVIGERNISPTSLTVPLHIKGPVLCYSGRHDKEKTPPLGVSVLKVLRLDILPPRCTGSRHYTRPLRRNNSVVATQTPKKRQYRIESDGPDDTDPSLIAN